MILPAWSAWSSPRSFSGCPWADRPALAAPLLAHAEDAADHDLPLLIWYGLIPVADADLIRPGPARRLVRALPTTRRLIARRLAEEIGPEARAGWPRSSPRWRVLRTDRAYQGDILQGLAEGPPGMAEGSEAPRLG